MSECIFNRWDTDQNHCRSFTDDSRGDGLTNCHTTAWHTFDWEFYFRSDNERRTSRADWQAFLLRVSQWRLKYELHSTLYQINGSADLIHLHYEPWINAWNIMAEYSVWKSAPQRPSVFVLDLFTTVKWLIIDFPIFFSLSFTVTFHIHWISSHTSASSNW